MTAPTEAHRAALDALEGMVREGYGVSDSAPFAYESDCSACKVLLEAGRLEHAPKNRICFVTPPKPKLTAEEVEEAMRLADKYAARFHPNEAIITRNTLRTYLTSLTQKGE